MTSASFALAACTILGRGAFPWTNPAASTVLLGQQLATSTPAWHSEGWLCSMCGSEAQRRRWSGPMRQALSRMAIVSSGRAAVALDTRGEPGLANMATLRAGLPHCALPSADGTDGADGVRRMGVECRAGGGTARHGCCGTELARCTGASSASSASGAWQPGDRQGAGLFSAGPWT